MAIGSSYKLYNGPTTLAGDFPPTLNKDQDATKLEVNESPDAYGVNWDTDGILATGSVPTGVARVAPVGTGAYTGWNFYYNRLMKVNATASQLDIGSPEYRAMYYAQDVGSRTAPANIVTFMPCLQDSLWVATATGSQLMQNMTDPRGFFWLGDFEQEFFVDTANMAITLGGVPYICNAKGVFSWDGKEVKELTRAVRNHISPFASVAILADYDEKLVIGTAKFVIDTTNGKLFDYSKSGFLFTSRTMSQPATEGLQPFNANSIAFLLNITASGNQKIVWETKTDNNAWYKEPDILINDKAIRVERGFNNPATACREFTMRITSMTSGVRIREIQLVVQGYSQEMIVE